MGGDLANGPDAELGSTPMTRYENNATRLERAAPGQSFTPLTHAHQTSAWVRDLEWGGGLALAALVLGFGWLTVRPTPRRRQPEIPAPARARVRR
jgi:hypothetical protein